MDRPDDEAWLLELAARIDEGRPIDWVRVEAAAGPESLDAVRALQVIEAMAIRGRQPPLAIESAAVTELPPTPPPQPPPDAEPGEGPPPDRYRSSEPSPPEEIRRKLLFGVSLVLSLASVYVGLLAEARPIQFALVGLAVVVAIIALFTGAKPPAPPPSDATPGGKSPA